MGVQGIGAVGREVECVLLGQAEVFDGQLPCVQLMRTHDHRNANPILHCLPELRAFCVKDT